jgi:hypothetical protein
MRQGTYRDSNQRNWLAGPLMGWSGRASQEFPAIWLCGLASMYPASDWSGWLLRAIMDISAQAI